MKFHITVIDLVVWETVETDPYIPIMDLNGIEIEK